jgi:hypothetical protein
MSFCAAGPADRSPSAREHFMDYAVWNTLHDGSIDAIHGSVPGDLHVRVDIEYLCQKLPTKASHVVVHLRGCRQFAYRPFEGGAVNDLQEIATAGVEVLSAKEVSGSVSVCCVGGFLNLAYDRAEISLAEGRAISQAELEAAADRYWTEWKETVRRARG